LITCGAAIKQNPKGTGFAPCCISALCISEDENNSISPNRGTTRSNGGAMLSVITHLALVYSDTIVVLP
jgi:hypothetical protein